MSSETSVGAYGFRLLGLDDGAGRLINVPVDWPQLVIECVASRGEHTEPPGAMKISDNTATLWLANGDRIEMERQGGIVRFVTSKTPGIEEMVHPLLGIPAAIMSMWRGRLSFHGGAFCDRAGAWALLGDRGAGKSTTLAQLLSAGRTIVSDDLLVIDGRTLYAGPRSIDLRSEAAEMLGGEPMGILGSRTRWRLRPDSAQTGVPILGFIKLGWGEQISITALDPRERLQLLYANSAVFPSAETASALLELLVLPAWRFTRPNDLKRSDVALGQLVDLLGP